jgi:hypothetical protein
MHAVNRITMEILSICKSPTGKRHSQAFSVPRRVGALPSVMAGLVPAIHAFLNAANKTWMPATSAGMTNGAGGLRIARGRE